MGAQRANAPDTPAWRAQAARADALARAAQRAARDPYGIGSHARWAEAVSALRELLRFAPQDAARAEWARAELARLPRGRWGESLIFLEHDLPFLISEANAARLQHYLYRYAVAFGESVKPNALEEYSWGVEDLQPPAAFLLAELMLACADASPAGRGREAALGRLQAMGDPYLHAFASRLHHEASRPDRTERVLAAMHGVTSLVCGQPLLRDRWRSAHRTVVAAAILCNPLSAATQQLHQRHIALFCSTSTSRIAAE